jgi:mRNA-degrading endonuclease RelE of RelBE toxin-antitoxin system
MSEYRIFETEAYLNGLDKLSETDRERVQKNLSDYAHPLLREQPFLGANIPRLRGYSPKVWLYRIGPFRLFYTVDDEACVVSVLTIAS